MYITPRYGPQTQRQEIQLAVMRPDVEGAMRVAISA